jgi:hypothetical protein
MENQWLEVAVVASLLPTMIVGKEHGCTVAIVARTAGDCPNIVVEDDAAVL